MKRTTGENKPTFDIMMGVGERYYPDPSFFLEETLRLGLSKRIPGFIEFYSPSRNKLWLVHWKTRKIFMFVTGLKYRVMADPGSEACKKAKEELGEENVICAPPGSLPGDSGRGCGSVNPRGRYVRHKAEPKKTKKLA